MKRVDPFVARISFVMGKGGVGRTTVAASLALDFARRGERVLLVDPKGGDELLARLRGVPGGIPDRLEVLQVSERALVDDVVKRVTRLGAMTEVVFRHPGYEAFLDLVPGVRELALLNLVYEERQRGERARIVIDAPATGHGLHFLEAPDKAAGMLVGKLKERAERLKAMLHDPATTEVVLVTLPEEVPVRESAELATRLREQGFPLDNVVVNKWLPRVFSTPASSRVLDDLTPGSRAVGRLARAVGRDPLEIEEATRALALVRAHRREAEARLADLAKLGAPIALVPWTPDATTRLEDVARALRSSAEEVAA